MEPLEATDACRPPTPAFLAGLVLSTLHALAGLALGVTLLAIGFGDQEELADWLTSRGWSTLDTLVNFAGLSGVLYTLLFTVQLFACATGAFGSRAGTCACRPEDR